MKTLAAALAALAMSTGLATAAEISVLAYPQPADSKEFYTAIEIPAGTSVKYETDTKTGLVVVDRFLSMPMAYPTNYGSITSSRAADGDPLDALVYSREPIVPGALIRVRAIGVMKMIDGGDQDDKIIAVPVSKVDPTYEGIKTIDDLPKMDQERLKAFFAVYKNLPEGSKKVEVGGFDGVEKAHEEIAKALEAYKQAK